MSLRKKIIIVIGSITIVIIAAILSISQAIFMNSFQALEKQDAENNVARLVSALSSQLKSLDTLSHDWANWDDTYEFVQHPNQAYIDSNPTDETFANAQLNLILIIDSSGFIVFSKAFDLDNEEEIPLWPSLHEHLSADVLIHHADTRTSSIGVILLPEGSLMVSSRPIVTSKGQGPIAGTIIMGRFLGPKVVNSLAETVHMPVTFSRLDDEGMPPDFQLARSSLSKDSPVFVRALSEDSIGGYAFLEDIYGKPALIAKVELPRHIYAQGSATVRYFTLSTLALGILFGTATLLLLSKLVIARLIRLNKDVAAIGASGDISMRLQVTGNDEVSSLAGQINDMLSSLEQSKESLGVSEKKYRDLVEHANDGIMIVQDGVLRYANPRLVEMSAYSARELVGNAIGDFIYREPAPKLSPYCDDLSGGDITQCTYEAILSRKNGGDMPVELNSSSIVYEDKPAQLVFVRDVSERKQAAEKLRKYQEHLEDLVAERTAALAAANEQLQQDITERKRAEDMLKVSQERYRTLVESANETICVIQDGVIKFANPRAVELSGYSLEKPIAFIELVHPDDREMLISRYLKRLEGEEIPSIYPFRIIDKEGDTKWVELNSARITWGGNPAVLVLLTDITERKQAEVALQREKLLGDSIVENTPAGIAFLDNDFVLRKCNSVYADLIRTYTPYTPEQALGMSYYDYTPGSRPQVEGWFQKVRDTGQVDTRYGFGLVLQKDGQELATYWDTSVAPVLNVAGKVEGILILTQDVTEHKRQEEERKQLEQKAQITSRLASVGKMAAGVAHEINNPLTGVIGYAQLLMAREDVASDVRGDLAAINDGAQRVAGIVKRLLAFSRQTKPERRYVDVNELIESTLALQAYHLRVNNIKVTTQLAPDVPQTVADPGQIQQVFLNLIVNAEIEMKSAHGKGKLTITTEKSDNTIKVCFKDDGPGIKPEIIERVFDPFFTTREVGQGTGLGLSLCYGIVAEHNGRIYVESKLGKGATFVVELPVVAEAEPPKPIEPVVEEPEKVAKARILVVDDEKVIRDLVKRVLGGEGYEVDTVDNAADALKKIEGKRYNLVLLDIKMPGMDGVELYKRIQKIAKSLARRVVFITGDIMGAATEKFLSETKVAHIGKPFNAEQLSREVNRALTAGR